MEDGEEDEEEEDLLEEEEEDDEEEAEEEEAEGEELKAVPMRAVQVLGMEIVSAGEADGDVVDEPNKYCCCLWPAVRVSEEMGSKKEGRRSGIMGGKLMRVADQKRFTDRENPGAGSYASSTMRQCPAPVVVKRWGDRGEGLGVMASVQKKGQEEII